MSLYQSDPEAFINECIAVCHNYVKTGQTVNAMRMLSTLHKAVPDNPLLNCFESEVLDFMELSFNINGGEEFFGKDWRGEDLNGKSIEIFADQGVGDLFMLLRYLEEMKRRWDCRMSLNCYSHHELVFDALSGFDFIDRVTNEHIICDYQTNLFSVPALLNDMEVFYPAHFAQLLETIIPEQPILRSGVLAAPSEIKRIGVAWESNPNNTLCQKKSINPELLRYLKGDVDFISLLPGRAGFDFIDENRHLESFMDTAKIMSSLDAVISVDTAVLHLAGTMQKPTFALLAESADHRWGSGDTTPWYPSMRLFRQVTEGSWTEPLDDLAKTLRNV